MGLETKKLGGSILFLLNMMLLLAASTVLRIEAAAEAIMSTNSNSSNSGIISSSLPPIRCSSGEEDAEECLLVSIAEMHPELEFLADSDISRRTLQSLNYGTLGPTSGRGVACRKDSTGRYYSCTTNKGSSPKEHCAIYKRLNHCS